LLLLVVTIRLFIRIGKGTLAPWDPTQKLVTEGVYGHVRNPMISGVSSMVLGESILLGSRIVLAWFFIVVIAHTIYFKLSEEPGLVKRFGNDYRRYRANVPMWIPRLKAWSPNDK
jgi:protein-S-isoprenylcysteine O-methyltransferase Ste14